MIDTEGTAIMVESGRADEKTAREILRNLQALYGTETGEQALDRDFGIDMDILNHPLETAKALLAAEFVRKTEQYEPRARVLRVEWPENQAKDGHIAARVVVSIV